MQKVIFFLILLQLGCQRTTSWETPKGGDFVLKTPTGELNTKELRRKTLFIFFGFLHCPHVCPTTIRELNRMAKSLTPEQKAKTAFIFISVDPERDTLSKLQEYFAEKDPAFITATGSEEEIRKAIKLYGGNYQIIKGETPDDTIIDHTTTVFVVNRKGVWVNSLDYDSTTEEFKRALDLSHSQKPFWSDEAKTERIKVLGFNQECDLGMKPCDFTTESGEKYEVELTPRPVRHLQDTKISVRTKSEKLVPIVADFIGVELSMGLIRPKLVKSSENSWSGQFKLPTCDLKGMTWHLRLLLQDSEKENHEIKFRFSSINL